MIYLVYFIFFLFALLPGNHPFKITKKTGLGLYPAEESGYVQCQYRNHNDATHKVFCSNPFIIPTSLNLQGFDFNAFSFQNSKH